MPAVRAVFSLRPVAAAVSPKACTTEVPCVPLKTLGRPQMLSAAMRPCLLAGPASGMQAGRPETLLRISTASPTA